MPKNEFLVKKSVFSVINHGLSSALRSSEDATTLSQYVHDLKDCGVEFELKWKIEQRVIEV